MNEAENVRGAGDNHQWWTNECGHGNERAMTDKAITFEPGANRARDLRRAFGRFGTGVTVVTIQTPNGPMGMTANSFSSISLDPPLVLWSPGTASRRHDAFTQTDAFCIHILGHDQLPTAMHFAENGGGFDGFDWTPNKQGAPFLAGCLAVFHCTMHAVHPAGDHSLVLGLVRQFTVSDTTRPGLIFEQGRYGITETAPQ